MITTVTLNGKGITFLFGRRDVLGTETLNDFVDYLTVSQNERPVIGEVTLEEARDISFARTEAQDHECQDIMRDWRNQRLRWGVNA